MNKCIVGEQTETLIKSPRVQGEAVELARKVKAQLQEPDPEREDLINGLQAKIKSGAYDASSTAVAVSILQTLKRIREEGD